MHLFIVSVKHIIDKLTFPNGIFPFEFLSLLRAVFLVQGDFILFVL